MNKKLLWISMTLMCFGLHAQKLIKGKVVDQNSGNPLPGATVVVKNQNIGTTTNEKGTFELEIPENTNILMVNFIGYQKKEVSIFDGESLIIRLISSSDQLEEVVVTALNQKRNSRDLGYAIQKIEGKEVAEVKSPNFVDNLAGNVAGVTVSQGATGVGSTSKITIRGETSFTNNNPLFVVDGVPINNNSNVNFTSDAAAGFQEVDFGNGAMEINQDDVASVSVLKGPSAAALYGTRAKNGVIIINTKNGSEAEGWGVTFNTSTFIEQPFQLPQFQNQYGQGNSGQFEFVDGLGGGVNDNISYSWGPALDQGLMIPQFDSPVELSDGTTVRGGDVAVHGGAPITPTPFNSYPDNLKDYYETGVTTMNNVAVSTAGEMGSFRLSFSDMRSDSYIPGVNLDRNTVASHMVFRPLKGLEIDASINYINSRSDNRPSSGYGSENTNYSLVAWGPRSLDISAMKDYWQPGLEGLQQYSFNYTFFDNPYFIMLENRNAFNRDRVMGGVGATYKIDKRFSVKIHSGMDYSDELRSFRRAFSTNRFINGAYAEQTVFFREMNHSAMFNYEEKFAHFTINATLGVNKMDQEISNRQTEALSLAQPGVYNFSNAAVPLNFQQFESLRRINSIFGTAQLGYKETIYLDVTGRNDWSSSLATPESAANVSFFYPSVALSYIISSTIEMPVWISFGKLRANWAQVGNDTDPYQTSGVYFSGTPYNNNPTFSAQNTLPATNLLPELTSAFEVGTEWSFFQNRLGINLTYFNSESSNQIVALPIAISSGYNQKISNGGKVRSQGLEAIVSVQPIRSEQFNWNMMFNFSTYRATVTEMPENAESITLAYSRIYDNVNQTVWFIVEEGGQIGDMYGTGYLKNENGDFVIDENGEYIASDELIKLGNFNPDFMLGWNNQLSYKNWNLNFLWDWRQGGEMVSRTLALGAVGGQLIETENRPNAGIVAEGVVNVGTDEEPIWKENTTAVPAESYYRQFYDRNHEENNTYDASYLKLRQVSLSYTFKGDKVQGFLKSGRSFRVALMGRNLFAFTKIPHFDPEQLAVQGNRFVSGVEDMSYPSARSIGIKLSYNL